MGLNKGDAFRRSAVKLTITRLDLGAVVGTMTWEVSQADPVNATPCVERVLLSRRAGPRAWTLRIARFSGSSCTNQEQSWTYTITLLRGPRLRITAASSAAQYHGWLYRGTLLSIAG